MRPDFVVIGAMKCATSSVCAYLEQHPEVFMVPRSDPNFFSDDAIFARGCEWYESLFEPGDGKKIRGEGSNDYSWTARYPGAAPRMFEYHPGLMLIFMARHPIERIISAWVQMRSDSGDAVPPTLDACVSDERYGFVEQSLYWKNISHYRRWFPDSQIFVGFLKDLNSDPPTFFTRLCDFLGIEVVLPAEGVHRNPSVGKVVPTPLYSAIKKLSITRTVTTMVPTRIKQAVRQRVLSRTVKERPRFSPDVERRLMGMLREDALEFLAYAGKSPDFWSLHG